MSGIGKHEYSTNHQNVYRPDLAVCPYCGTKDCEADWVDVGIGLTQCGPYHCEACGAIEIGAYDKPSVLDDKEKETGWYKPGREYGGCSNTVGGRLVKHDVAMAAYRMGLLDEKK